MKWICKVTNFAGQKRITLPKKFISLHDFEEVEYFIIDDQDPRNIKLGGLLHGEKDQSSSQDG